jgi:hypothetical protein
MALLTHYFELENLRAQIFVLVILVSPRELQPPYSRTLVGEYKATKRYPEFYPQLAAPRMTISDFERRVAPLSC